MLYSTVFGQYQRASSLNHVKYSKVSTYYSNALKLNYVVSDVSAYTINCELISVCREYFLKVLSKSTQYFIIKVLSILIEWNFNLKVLNNSTQFSIK